MHILPGLHKKSLESKKLISHAQDRDWQICDIEVERMRREEGAKCAAVCLKPGLLLIGNFSSTPLLLSSSSILSY